MKWRPRNWQRILVNISLSYGMVPSIIPHCLGCLLYWLVHVVRLCHGCGTQSWHDDVIKMKKFSALLALCDGNSPVTVNSPHKGQWGGALMFSLICAWTNDWVYKRDAGDFRRHRIHCDVTVMVRSTYDESTNVFTTRLRWICPAMIVGKLYVHLTILAWLYLKDVVRKFF